jgi:arylsulfatase A-like enzyme
VPRPFFDRHPPAAIRLPAVLPDDLADVGPLARGWVERTRVHSALLEPETARRAIQGYVAAAAFADELVGRLLAAWDASPHGAGGIVVLWSDHGFHLGEKLHWRKATLWEETCRVPLIVVAPGRGFAPAACGRTVGLLDLYPTLIDLCGLPPRPGLGGRSLLPLLAAPERGWPHPAVTVWYEPGSASVRSERWRYTRYADGFEELYDHDADPHEWTNLAGRPESAGVAREHALHLP